jgi:hypothetical protein
MRFEHDILPLFVLGLPKELEPVAIGVAALSSA